MSEPELTPSQIEDNLRFHICESAKHLHEVLNGLGPQMWLVGRTTGEKRFDRIMQLLGELWQISERNNTLSIALDNLTEFQEEQTEKRRSEK